jgi:hypothetical protein
MYGRKDSNSFYLASIKIPGSSVISNVSAQFSPIPLKLASIQLDDFGGGPQKLDSVVSSDSDLNGRIRDEQET